MDSTFLLVLVAWGLAGASPGPATLAIAGSAMQHGRASGLSMATGVIIGSACWGVAAAGGMSAIMQSHGWVVELIRYVGALYLLFLALKAARSALADKPMVVSKTEDARLYGQFWRGFLIHITNPKAIFAWGAIFAVVVPAGSDISTIIATLLSLICVSMLVFWGYGILFFTSGAISVYRLLRRWIEGVFSVMFGYAAFKILTSRMAQ